MHASEARKIAKECYYNNINNTLHKVEVAIEEACKKGKYTVSIFEHLPSEVQEKLKDRGYKINQIFKHNDTSYYISW